MTKLFGGVVMQLIVMVMAHGAAKASESAFFVAPTRVAVLHDIHAVKIMTSDTSD